MDKNKGGSKAMITQEHDQEPRNFRNPDPLNCSLEGRIITVSLLNGRIESGKLKVMGQYSMLLELPNKRDMIINKSAVLLVSVL
jgi:sRNA-binding regulator protein Hfq